MSKTESKKIVRITFNDVTRFEDHYREDVKKATAYPQFVIGYDLGEQGDYRIIYSYGGVEDDDEERFSPKNFYLLIPKGAIIQEEELLKKQQRMSLNL